jgi:F-type H+-transporting ATPase subunit b
MSKRLFFRPLSLRLLLACLLLACGCLFAQPALAARPATMVAFIAQHGAESSAGEQAVPVPPGKEPEVVPEGAAHGHAEGAEHAEGHGEGAEHEVENAQFRYSAIVRAVAAKTGLSNEAAYWSFFSINFAILAAGFVWVLRRAMPQGFAPRTAEIQRSLEEARKASAEASARLGEIEGRLAVLDHEIEEIRRAAEADFSGEEQRIRADAERDAKHVVAAAEQEIAAASRSAQRELKAFAAGLAIDLAEKKIKVDDVTDQAIIRSFAAQLGKDGQ